MDEREGLARQLEYLAELDRRKLFFEYSSLRAFLVGQYRMEEWRAEQRVRAARLLKRFPEIKAGIESGKMNFTLLEIAQGCAHREKLTDPELAELLKDLAGMSCAGAERELARRFPGSVKLPRDRIRPLTEDLSEVRFVANEELLEKLEDIRGLLAHSHPGLSMAELIDILATEYRTRHHPEERAKRATARAERKDGTQEKQDNEGEQATETVKTPTVPLDAVRRSPSRRTVHELIRKQGYQCSYGDPITQGRCQSRHGLELDHLKPWSLGGKTEISNLRFLCRNHHRRVSFQQFGESWRYFAKHRGFS